MTERQNAETALRSNEERLQTLNDTLDEQVKVRTNQLEQRNTDVLRQSAQLVDLSSRLMQLQDDERRRIALELHDSLGQLVAAVGMKLVSLSQHAKPISPQLATIT